MPTAPGEPAKYASSISQLARHGGHFALELWTAAREV